MPALFKEKLTDIQKGLRKSKIEILQVNLGKLCNMTCSHCHVEAGPSKTKENMTEATVKEVVKLLDFEHITTLDLTGGAPELNPYFRYFVEEARARKIQIIDRCNLTVLFEKGQEDLAEFLSGNHVEVIASLPCYSEVNVDKQRGKGAFSKSIQALILLNRLGYGRENTGLKLNLVYNPVGAHLPPPQKKLEEDYKKSLSRDFGIVFNSLYTITNMPITRYQKYLKAKNEYDDYIELLKNNFNAGTLDGLMCRNTLSISWDGKLFDCDFNQMLHMQMTNGRPLTVHDIQGEDLENAEILLGEHCFGCTAGSGSSCQGALEVSK